MNYIAELTWFKSTEGSSFGYTKDLFDIIENIVNLCQSWPTKYTALYVTFSQKL